MALVNVVVPSLGESVVEATVGEWVVEAGDTVAVGDVLVSLETDKVDLEVAAENAGILTQILHAEGDDVSVGDTIATIDGDGTAPVKQADPAPAQIENTPPAPTTSASATPVAVRMANAEGVDLAKVSGTGKGGQVTKEDVQTFIAGKSTPSSPAPKKVETPKAKPAPAKPASASDRPEERTKMSRRRRTIATRLVEAQQTAAMLTTFNEIDMSAVMDMRKRRQEAFVKANDIKLGFMSFFVKATIGALKDFPRLNAEIDGDDMVVKKYYDIGMAIGADEGLVVPVIRDADRLSFAGIEQSIRTYATKVREGNLAISDLMGGTFTITNGGVFGSMMSTPILNPPQVGILGLHSIKKRPVEVNGEVAIRPMMYVALTYDHRIVDGSEAVRFLVRVKELIEDPEELLLAG